MIDNDEKKQTIIQTYPEYIDPRFVRATRWINLPNWIIEELPNHGPSISRTVENCIIEALELRAPTR